MSMHEYCEWHCGGTACTAPRQVSSATAVPRCRHDNGWYVVVPFLWIFRKRVFVCSDCGHVSEAQR